MKYVRLAVITMGFTALVGCNNSLQEFVDIDNPIEEPPSTTPTTLPPSPGYQISTAGKQLNGSNYKLHVRVGKVDQTETVEGSNYKVRTGLVRHLKDK